MNQRTRQEREQEWQVLYPRSKYMCAHCKDSCVCPNCHGEVHYARIDGKLERIDGCMSCDYTGDCPHCRGRGG